MSSLFQSTGSSPYVLVHTVGPLAATVAYQRYKGACHNSQADQTCRQDLAAGVMYEKFV